MTRKLLALTVCFASLLVPSRLLEAGTEQVGAGRQLRNSGFEDNIDGWSVAIYGARSTLTPDTEIVHDGKRSLRISAAAPSDTALSQEVQLEPGSCYRLSGWVRTRKLDHGTASVYGTLQIQRPGGNGILAT